MVNKIKIALVVAETAPIPDILGGGAERLVTMLIDQNEIEKKVQFVVTSKYNKKAKKLASKYKHTIFIYIRNKSPLTKIYNVLIRSMNKFLNANFKKHGYYDVIAKKLDSDCDILIDENGYCEEVGFLSESFGNEKIIAHIHWMVNPIAKNIDSFYGGVIGVSNYITNYWAQHSNCSGIERMTVYSAVDENRFLKDTSIENKLKLRNKYNINCEDFVYIYCGRLLEQKGVRELIEAFIKSDLANSKLIIIGGGNLKDTSVSEYEKGLHTLANKNENIIFTGYIDNENLSPLYGLADAQVIPTLVEEAAGLVAIEGMYSCLPIIATKSGGLQEYLDDKCSIMVEKDYDVVNNLSEAMKFLYFNREITKKMSVAARNRANNFTQKKYYNDFIENIEKYIRKKGI